jgi:putative transposase
MPDSGYETDLSNEQWAMVEEFIPPPKPGGRPRTTNMRRVFDACLYVVKTGCQWRQLPKDFPPWRTCYGYFVEWGSLVNQQGIFRRLHRRLYFQARKAAGRKPYPSVVIVDSQTVRTGKMVESVVTMVANTSKAASGTRQLIPSVYRWPSPLRRPTFMISKVERNR